MKCFCTFLLLLALDTVQAQPTKTLALDSFFHRLYRNGQLNGAVLVAEKGEPVYHGAFGLADDALKKPNDIRTRFTIGSVAKVFTATAVLQLKDKGKLRLDDPVVHHLPDFPFQAITIRHLLSQTSGLPDYELYGRLVDENPVKVFTNADLLPALQRWGKPLLFQPGEKWQYSNNNYSLLALVVEKITKMAFTAYVEKHIFRPAGMKATYFLAGVDKGNDSLRSVNHQRRFQFSCEPVSVDSIPKLKWRLYNLSGFTGQGNVISTADDLLRFDAALHANKLVKSATLAEAFTATRLNDGQPAKASIGIGKATYGLGWFIFADSSQGKVVWHTGGVPGGLSIFLRNISRQQTVVLLDNQFSEGLYASGVNALRLLNDQPIAWKKKSLVPSYGCTLVSKGSQAAFSKLIQLQQDSLHHYLDEEEMNLLGYHLLYESGLPNRNELALEVFRLNVLLFPKSYNVYDSYAEALARAQYTKEAIAMYQMALSIKPGNQESIEGLNRLKEKTKGPTVNE